ncbi:hypothetical protein OQA88_835 [Cercophora sp. LCS_1]
MAWIRELGAASDLGDRTSTSMPPQPHVETIKKFFQRSWFHRVWLIQETFFAKRALLICGGEELEWADLCTLYHWIGVSVRKMEGLRLPYVVGHTAYRSGSASIPWFQEYATLLVRRLEETRHCQATDPRDKLYAILPLVDAEYQENLGDLDEGNSRPDHQNITIQPDYSLTPAQVYTNLATALLPHIGLSNLLSHHIPGTPIPDLPLWVPNWSISPTIAFFTASYPDDTCQMLLSRATEAQFMAWHPFLNGNCNGLWAGNYYCTWAGSEMPPPPTVTYVAVGEPVKPWITINCQRWYRAFSDTCQDIVDIGTNPSVGTNCSKGVEDDYCYCVGVPGTPAARTAAPIPIPTGTVPEEEPVLTQPGITPECVRLQIVHVDDTCERIASRNRISVEDFLAWNPSVGTGCAGLVPDYHVCVSVTDDEATTTTGVGSAGPTPTNFSSSIISSGSVSVTSSAPVTSTAGSGEGGAPAPSPVQAGIATACRRYYKVQENDGCWAIANAAGIQLR